MSFSSKDFDRTPSKLHAKVPDKLLHANVMESGDRKEFSAARRHKVAVVDLPSKVISMTLGGLEPSQKTNRHRHNYETILYIIKGRGMSLVEGKEVMWKAGDAVYVPVWAWHQHCNLSTTEHAEYIACENAPMLQNLGEIALREEAND